MVENPLNQSITRPASYGHLLAGVLGLTSIYALRVLAMFLARTMYRFSLFGIAVLVDGIIHLSLVILSVIVIIPMVAFSGVQIQRALQLYRNQIAPSTCRYVIEMLLIGSLITTGSCHIQLMFSLMQVLHRIIIETRLHVYCSSSISNLS